MMFMMRQRIIQSKPKAPNNFRVVGGFKFLKSMSRRKFGYMETILNGKSTRERSGKQESRIAKQLNGHLTINSGATLGQNDVITDFCEIEAKTTEKESFSLRLSDWRLLRKKCAPNKLPIFIVDFEQSKDTLAILTYEDLQFLINQINSEKT